MRIKVVGTTFDNRQDIIARLKGNEPVRLVHEAHNQYDPNAIAVHVTCENAEVCHIGYLPKELAATIDTSLNGPSITATIHEITGGYEISEGYYASRGVTLDIQMTGDEDELPF